jgi:hypothetical protein
MMMMMHPPPPPFLCIHFAWLQVYEMSAADTAVGQLLVSDPDNNGLDGPKQNFTFTILGDSQQRFYISGSTLKVLYYKTRSLITLSQPGP